MTALVARYRLLAVVRRRAMARGAVVIRRAEGGSMSGTNKENLLQFIAAVHGQLATFAQESFGMNGRGVVRVEVPTLPDGAAAALGITAMVYHTHQELREMFAETPARERKDADVLLRMIETYDPFAQMVVMVAAETGNPITVKVRLAEPFIEES